MGAGACAAVVKFDCDDVLVVSVDDVNEAEHVKGCVSTQR